MDHIPIWCLILTFYSSLPWGGGKAEVVPSPSVHDSKGLEGLEPGNVGPEGKVSISDLQRGCIRTCISAYTEGLHYFASLLNRNPLCLSQAKEGNDKMESSHVCVS